MMDERNAQDAQGAQDLHSTGQPEGDDYLIAFGSAAKALGGGRVGGYLVTYGDPSTKDTDDEFFSAKTDFRSRFPSGSHVYYNHGLDRTLDVSALPDGEMKADDVGVWIETQLDMADRYQQAIYALAKSGKLSWSSGSVSHLIRREKAGAAKHITFWPLGLDASLTPTPADFRNRAMALKSWEAESPDLLDSLPAHPVVKAPVQASSALSPGESLVVDTQRLTAAALHLADQGRELLPVYQGFHASARKDGRMLSAARRERLSQVHQSFNDALRQLGQMQDLIADLLTETGPDAPPAQTQTVSAAMAGLARARLRSLEKL